jgi:hypothetical protein
MLSIHLSLGLPSVLFPSGFPTNNLYTFLFSEGLYMKFNYVCASNIINQIQREIYIGQILISIR